MNWKDWVRMPEFWWAVACGVFVLLLCVWMLFNGPPITWGGP